MLIQVTIGKAANRQANRRNFKTKSMGLIFTGVEESRPKIAKLASSQGFNRN